VGHPETDGYLVNPPLLVVVFCRATFGTRRSRIGQFSPLAIVSGERFEALPCCIPRFGVTSRIRGQTMATLTVDPLVSRRTADFVTQAHHIYIDGRFVEAASGKTFPSTIPQPAM